MKKSVVLLPKQKRILQGLGESIKYARLRRKLSTEQVSERADISRKTLWAIERGVSTVSIGSYLQVLFVLGLENDLSFVAMDDKLGRNQLLVNSFSMVSSDFCLVSTSFERIKINPAALISPKIQKEPEAPRALFINGNV